MMGIKIILKYTSFPQQLKVIVCVYNQEEKKLK